MHAKEILQRYRAEQAVFQHNALLVTVNRSAPKRSVYDAVRFAWRIKLTKAKQAEVILAVEQGIIRGAFIADRWLDATVENFPTRTDVDVPGRYGFEGHEASVEVQRQYFGKRIPDEYRKRGAAYPIKYTW